MSREIHIVLDRLRSAHNVGNIFRIAEAIGACEIIACGYTPAPPHPKLAKTAMGTDLMVPCRTFPDSLSAIRQLRKENVKQIIAAEPMPGSIPVWKFDYQYPLAIIFGNEALGIQPETLQEVDAAVALPMYGTKASINVGNAAAAICYAIISFEDKMRNNL